jgi:hypothetical protein
VSATSQLCADVLVLRGPFAEWHVLIATEADVFALQHHLLWLTTMGGGYADIDRPEPTSTEETTDEINLGS